MSISHLINFFFTLVYIFQNISRYCILFHLEIYFNETGLPLNLSKSVKRYFLGNDNKIVQMSTDITGISYLINPLEKPLGARGNTKCFSASRNHVSYPVGWVL